MTKNGRPDTARAGNEILRNVLSGSVTFYFVPPVEKEKESCDSVQGEREKNLPADQVVGDEDQII